ncbi:MAG: urease accessory protein UreF [Chloroflexota bacterium]|nr:urease accessory protein UreF [Chloroflexota bacterium]MDE2958979.1 urease accessory protein UreF [Chloroflexota bacterium]
MTNFDGRHFLAALQLADSFFPSGTYAHSQGLEGMVTRAWVANADDLGEYLRNLLAWSILPCDGVALLNAHRTAQDADLATLVDIDWHLHAMKLPEELRVASCHAGRRILDETAPLLRGRAGSALHGEFRQAVMDRSAPGTGAVAQGVASCAAGIEAESALLMFCHSFAVGVLGAAQRLLPITHSEAQGILHALHEPVISATTALRHRDWREMTSFAPQTDIAAMLHEHDDVRMFAS